MTEKDYSGVTTGKIGKNAKANSNSNKNPEPREAKTNKVKNSSQNESTINETNDMESYRKAGKIAKQLKEYAKTIIKSGMPLVEIAEKIESKIIELGGEVAFPVNLSIDDVAAHYSPSLRDETLASGLLKIDLGVHVNGYICDIAFSLDLTHEKKYSKLIEASEKALKNALEEVKAKKENTQLNEIGKIIQETIKSHGFTPIANLSGHGLDKFDIHSGLTIPNIDNGNIKTLGEGAFAIEPFSTYSTGSGMVYDGNPSTIYHLTGKGLVRDSFARQVLEFIFENKKTLPFSQRELEKKFGSRVILALSNLKRAGAINEFPQLIEKSHSPVSQAETSFIIHKGVVEILVEGD